MVDFIGKKVVVKTEQGVLEGRLVSYNEDDGRLEIEDSLCIRKELGFMDVLDVNTVESSNKPPNGLPLEEMQMHRLFYEAFNIYGPLEDNFCWLVAYGLKKFAKDLGAARVKIVIGSDDVFGRIGLCLARVLHEKVERADVILACNIFDLRTLRYKDMFLNSGGRFEENQKNVKYTLTIYATNRHFDFSEEQPSQGQVIIIDLPSAMPFENFVGIGLGFIPENHSICPGYYIMDCGFNKILCDKFQICSQFKGFVVKVFEDKKTK